MRKTPDELNKNLQMMLAVRFDLSQQVAKLPRHQALMLHQHIAELDGYLTLQAPTDKVH